MIDMAISTNRNTAQKEAKKKLKYKSLCIAIQRMWNLKWPIVPVIIGATGVVTRSLRKNVEAVPGKHSIDSLQKTVIIRTSHIIRKVLQCEAWSLSGGDHHWFKRSTRQKRPVTETSISYNNNKRMCLITQNHFLQNTEIRSKIHLIYFSHLKLNPTVLLNECFFFFCMTSSCENGLNGQHSHAMYLQKLASKYYKTFLVSFFHRRCHATTKQNVWGWNNQKEIDS